MVFDNPEKNIEIHQNHINQISKASEEGRVFINTMGFAVVICWKCKGAATIMAEIPIENPQPMTVYSVHYHHVTCDICKGKRYIKINSDILEVYYE